MPNSLKRRILPLTSAAAVAVLAVGVLAGPANAASGGDAKKKFNLDNLAYAEFIRAGAIETFADVPRNVVQDGGFSSVDLRKDFGEATARCTVFGAGYYLGEEVEEGIIKGGAAPVAEGQTATDASPYENPTLSKKLRPETSAVDSSTEVAPAFPATGNGAKFTSECTDDFYAGTATGDVINAQGFTFAGSTTAGQLDKKTGLFTGTSRALITGFEGAFDSISSLMQVKHAPDKEPTVTFRLAFFNSEASKSGFTDNGFTLGGADIPAKMFVETFNQQAAANAPAFAAFGPAGLKILAPTVGVNQDSGRYEITSPVAEGNLGIASRTGTIGQNQGLRFAAITFTGDNVTKEGLG